MPESRTKQAPAGLGPKARKIWNEINRDFELRIDELRILEDACREVDLIERLESELKESNLLVAGSQGQPVASPLVQEIRQHRAGLARLFIALKLPADGEGDSSSNRSSSARAAANQRWRVKPAARGA